MQTGRREAERRVGLGGGQTLGELQDSGGEQEAVTELMARTVCTVDSGEVRLCDPGRTTE